MLKTELNEIEEIEIKAIEYESLELLCDLNLEKELIIEETKKIETKLGKPI